MQPNVCLLVAYDPFKIMHMKNAFALSARYYWAWEANWHYSPNTVIITVEWSVWLLSNEAHTSVSLLINQSQRSTLFFKLRGTGFVFGNSVLTASEAAQILYFITVTVMYMYDATDAPTKCNNIFISFILNIL